MPENIYASRRTQRDNSAIHKFQLRESIVRGLDDIAQRQARSLRCLERRRTTNDCSEPSRKVTAPTS